MVQSRLCVSNLLCYLVDTSSIAIVAALVGGVILGAGLEFVVILLMRRKTKSTDECQRYTIKQSQNSKTDSCTFQCICNMHLCVFEEMSLKSQWIILRIQIARIVAKQRRHQKNTIRRSPIKT